MKSMEIYITLSQALSALKVLRKRVDGRLTLLEESEYMERDTRISIQNDLLSCKEDILLSIQRLESIISKLYDDID